MLALGPPLIRCLIMILINHCCQTPYRSLYNHQFFKVVSTWGQGEVCSQVSASHVPWQRLKVHGRRPPTRLKRRSWEFCSFPPHWWAWISSWTAWKQWLEFPGYPGLFLHSCTQIILARGDLICKDEADDVLMFLSSALKYRINFSKWNPPWKPVSPKNGKPAPLVPKTGFLTCHGTWRGERVLK